MQQAMVLKETAMCNKTAKTLRLLDRLLISILYKRFSQLFFSNSRA
jgi:hypothetical protein